MNNSHIHPPDTDMPAPDETNMRQVTACVKKNRIMLSDICGNRVIRP